MVACQVEFLTVAAYHMNQVDYSMFSGHANFSMRTCAGKVMSLRVSTGNAVRFEAKEWWKFSSLLGDSLKMADPFQWWDASKL